jgi:hypothetical protein
MARKQEIEVVRPRKAIAALEGFNNDVVVLLAATKNAHSFMLDKTLDPARVCSALAETLGGPIAAVQRWYE